jgi:catechol 2,3-dioxygenase-like lactoylglutathione lyase family enzyme
MPLLCLEHYLVLTDDLELTRDFYCRGLGLQLGPRPPLAFPGYWLYLGNVPCIHVAEWESYRAHSIRTGIPVSERAPGTGPVDHLAFTALDCDAVKSQLRAYGLTFAENRVPGANLTQLFLRDPNGVKVEINVATPTMLDSVASD